MIISSWPGWRWKSWPSPGLERHVHDDELLRARVLGAQRQPITPQSNCSCRTSPCLTNAAHLLSSLIGIALKRRMFSVIATSVGSRSIELAPKKPTTPSVSLEHVRGVVRLGDRAAVAEDEDLGVDALRGVVHRLDEPHRLVERLRRLGADRAAGRQAHVRHEHVRAGLAPSRPPRRRRRRTAPSGGRARARAGSCRPRARSPCRSPRGPRGSCRRRGRPSGSSGRR